MQEPVILRHLTNLWIDKDSFPQHLVRRIWPLTCLGHFIKVFAKNTAFCKSLCCEICFWGVISVLLAFLFVYHAVIFIFDVVNRNTHCVFILLFYWIYEVDRFYVLKKLRSKTFWFGPNKNLSKSDCFCIGLKFLAQRGGVLKRRSAWPTFFLTVFLLKA